MNMKKHVHLMNVLTLRAWSRTFVLTSALLALGACSDDLRDEPTSQPKSEVSKASPLADAMGNNNMALEFEVEPMQTADGARMSYYLEDRQARRGSAAPATAGYTYDDEFTPTINLKKDDEVSGFLVFVREKDNPSDRPIIIRESALFKVIDAPDHTSAYDTSIRPRVRWVGNINFPSTHTLEQEYALASSVALSGTDRVRELPTKLGKWYVIAMLDFTSGSYKVSEEASASESHLNKLYYNTNSPNDVNDPERRTSAASTILSASRRSSGNLGVPFISQWRQLKIVEHAQPGAGGTTYTGFADDLIFQPQGVLLQFDLKIVPSDVQELRRYGLVSNQVDFRGYYDLAGPSLYERFENRGAEDKGVPVWVPNTPNMYGYKLYYPNDSETVLSSGERLAPWDMPTISSSWTDTWGGTSAQEIDTSDAALCLGYPMAKSRSSYLAEVRAYSPTPNLPNPWALHPLGGSFRGTSAPKAYPSKRTIAVFWGMPRKNAPTNRYTYFFTSAYQVNYESDVYNASVSWDPKVRISDAGRAARNARIDFRRTERNIDIYTRLVNEFPDAGAEPGKSYKERLDTLQKEYQDLKTKYPESFFTQYSADSTLYWDTLLPDFVKQVTARTQPLVVVYQSNASFTPRKVYHAQAVLTSDLILSDVIYKTANGENYSAVEIYNPNWVFVDLSQYALARLIPNNGHMSFRKADGTATDDIKQAQLLPLSAVAPNETTPYNTDVATLRSPFPDPHASDGYWGKNILRRRVIMGQNSITRNASGNVSGFAGNRVGLYSVSRSSDSDPGLWNFGDLLSDHMPAPSRNFINRGAQNKAYLLSNQSILLGASGYIHNPPVDDNYTIRPGHSWFEGTWDNAIYGPMATNSFIRHFVAYADGKIVSEGQQENNSWLTTNLGYNPPSMRSFSRYEAGTLDMNIGDGFVLLKMNQQGGWQIIDATAPVGVKGEAFAGTYTDYKAHYDALKATNPTSYSQQRLEGAIYPFISPFRTERISNQAYSTWSDTWRTTTTETEYTIGYYQTNPQVLKGVSDAVVGIFFNPFNPARTIFDPNFNAKWWSSYQRLRPTRR